MKLYNTYFKFLNISSIKNEYFHIKINSNHSLSKPYPINTKKTILKSSKTNTQTNHTEPKTFNFR